MARRIHVSRLTTGLIQLDPTQAHHVRDVLRIKLGTALEIFDDAGHVADAIVTRCDEQVSVRVEQIRANAAQGQIVVACAVPKGDRADWMIEKLSELGIARFVPLKTARSVVHPTGASKRDRWRRIATESAKQSHRSGVMQIDELAPLSDAIAQTSGIYLSTDPDAPSILSCSSIITQHISLALFVGPEGGWSEDEIAQFRTAGMTGAKLTQTILRVETAAIAAAAMVMAMQHE